MKRIINIANSTKNISTKNLSTNLCKKCNQKVCLCHSNWKAHNATDSEQIVKAEKNQHPFEDGTHPDKHIPEKK